MEKVAWVFPGQGSQWSGMGRDLYDNYASAKEIYDMADDALEFSLSSMCFTGDEDELRQTINAQPALLVTSYACLQAAKEASNGAFPAPSFAAGHSLGEYTALAASGVFSFSTAVKLARERGRLMHEAGQATPGSMAAIIGLDEAALNEVCQETGTCMANINSPGQIVISGAADKIAQAMELAKAKGAKRAIQLQVSGAFHSELMQPAVKGMEAFIGSIIFNQPSIPVIGNVSANPLADASSVRTELLDQLCHPVQWQRSIEYMVANGVNTFIEIGPGKVLTGLIKRINKEVNTVNIGDVATVMALVTE